MEKLFYKIGLIIFMSFLFVLFLKNKYCYEGGDKGTKYEYGLTMEELTKRTSESYLGKISLLKSNATEYEELQEGDKKALLIY